MKNRPAFLLALLLPAPALAGAEYTAEDVIRYFEQANAAAAAAAPAPSVARTAPAAGRGIAIGEPAVPGPQGVVIGGAAPARAQGVVVGGAAAASAGSGGAPLAIPMTGAKAGHGVGPGAPSTADTVPGGYDMLVTFELDSAVLTPQARQNLDAFARALVSPALAGLRFAVEGHTDATGSPEHNLALSRRRAESVVSYLVGHGVAPDRLTAAGFGESRPRLADPEHPDNRRVETRRMN